MKVTHLSITNLRAFKNAEFEFRPGMNLLVGLNGLGKTTVLHALCDMLANVLVQVNEFRISTHGFDANDIRWGTNGFDLQIKCEVPGYSITSSYHKPRQEFLEQNVGSVRNAIIETKEKRSVVAVPIPGGDLLKIGKETQIPIYFSTKRTIPTQAKTSSRKGGGEKAAALSDALSSRELSLSDIAHWIRTQEELGLEEPSSLLKNRTDPATLKPEHVQAPRHLRRHPAPVLG